MNMPTAVKHAAALLKRMESNDFSTKEEDRALQTLIRYARVAVAERIYQLMDGKEWSADTLDSIADILATGGFELHNYEEETAAANQDDKPF